jgi:hypothetical protein
MEGQAGRAHFGGGDENSLNQAQSAGESDRLESRLGAGAESVLASSMRRKRGVIFFHLLAGLATLDEFVESKDNFAQRADDSW